MLRGDLQLKLGPLDTTAAKRPMSLEARSIVKQTMSRLPLRVAWVLGQTEGVCPQRFVIRRGAAATTSWPGSHT